MHFLGIDMPHKGSYVALTEHINIFQHLKFKQVNFVINNKFKYTHTHNKGSSPRTDFPFNIVRHTSPLR